jgi:glycine/serine hydroxymethyltransferase
MDQIAEWINTIAENLTNEDVIAKVGRAVEDLCRQFPLPDQFIQQ